MTEWQYSKASATSTHNTVTTPYVESGHNLCTTTQCATRGSFGNEPTDSSDLLWRLISFGMSVVPPACSLTMANAICTLCSRTSWWSRPPPAKKIHLRRNVKSSIRKCCQVVCAHNGVEREHLHEAAIGQERGQPDWVLEMVLSPCHEHANYLDQRIHAARRRGHNSVAQGGEGLDHLIHNPNVSVVVSILRVIAQQVAGALLHCGRKEG